MQGSGAAAASRRVFCAEVEQKLIPGPSRGVQWRCLSSVGASIGDLFEGAGRVSVQLAVFQCSFKIAPEMYMDRPRPAQELFFRNMMNRLILFIHTP